MIVISGALVLVALVLLVLGLTMTELQFVYGSIGVSLVSFVFLVIGILQRRGEPAPASPPVSGGDSTPPADAEQDAAPPARAVPAATRAGAAKTGAVGSVPVVEDDLDDDELEPGGGPVLVVQGRPRYHVEGCRYLTGKSAEELDVLDARDDGFSPCGVCKPDEVLEELYGELPLDGVDGDEPEDEDDDVLDTGVPGGGDDEPAVVPASRSRSGSATAALPAPAATARTSAPAKKAPAAKKAAAKPAAKPATKPATKPAAKKAPAQAAADVPAATPAAAPAAPAAAAPAKAAPRGKVVVIPERDRFHTPSCRFVKGVAGTESLTRAQAGKQGFQACGVCKP